MSSKLRNIDAIKKMLDGQHHRQTKTTSFGYKGNEKKVEDRAVGESWTDEKGVEWIQRNGYKIKKGKLDEIRAIVQSRVMPKVCPKCGNPMEKRLDKKFWFLEKHCFDCQVLFEHNLKIEGKYEAYEKERVLKNAEAWLNEAEAEAIELAKIFKDPVTFANSDGSIEKWDGGITPEQFADKIEEEFKQFKTNFINKLKQDLYHDKVEVNN